MRQQRQRVFDITINGKTTREDANGRVAIEVQHDIAQRVCGSIRVVEKYIGGARQKRVSPEDERGEP